jgi:hypothetical protein
LNRIALVDAMWDAAGERDQVRAEWGGARLRISITGASVFFQYFPECGCELDGLRKG